MQFVAALRKSLPAFAVPRNTQYATLYPAHCACGKHLAGPMNVAVHCAGGSVHAMILALLSQLTWTIPERLWKGKGGSPSGKGYAPPGFGKQLTCGISAALLLPCRQSGQSWQRGRLADRSRAPSQQAGGTRVHTPWQRSSLAATAASEEDTESGIRLHVPCKPGSGRAAKAPPWVLGAWASGKRCQGCCCQPTLCRRCWRHLNCCLLKQSDRWAWWLGWVWVPRSSNQEQWRCSRSDAALAVRFFHGTPNHPGMNTPYGAEGSS